MNFKKFAVGTIPSCWEIKLIDEIKSKDKNAIAMGPFGSRIKSDNFVSSGVPIIRGNNLKKYSFDETDFVFVTEEKAQELKSSIVRKGDLVITHRGTLGQVGIIPENSKYNQYIVSQSGLKISCDLTLVRPEFLYYFLNSRVGQYLLLRNTSQVGVPSIAQPTTSIKQIPVPIPSLIEQNQIVKVLSSIDQKIELNNQMNETLEEMAQALFKRWFVDFEFPNEDGQPYKSSGGEMVESELGMIPKGWKNGQLEDICGYSSNKIMIEKLDKNNYISTENMLPNKGGIIEASGLPTTSKVTSFNIGDTLISNIRPYFKKIYYCNQNGGCSNDVLCFNPKLKDYTYCLYLYLYEDNFFDYMMSGSKGTKMPRGDKKQIMRYPILIANSDIYIKFNKIVSPIFEKLFMLQEENKNLMELRDTLLPKLMSGEIRVSDLEG